MTRRDIRRTQSVGGMSRFQQPRTVLVLYKYPNSRRLLGPKMGYFEGNGACIRSTEALLRDVTVEGTQVHFQTHIR